MTDISHLDALKSRLGREKDRLANATNANEKAFRVREIASCEKEASREAALEARQVAKDAYADADAKNSARDKSLAEYAEAVVQILVEMKVPGVQWLELTEA